MNDLLQSAPAASVDAGHSYADAGAAEVETEALSVRRPVAETFGPTAAPSLHLGELNFGSRTSD